MPDQDEIAKFLAQDAESLVDQHARKYGVDPSLAKRVLKKESALRPDVLTGGRRSKAGAIGPMQLMPGTARELGVDPSNYEQNIEGGVKYLAQMQKQFGDPAKAAAAYNAGPGAVQKYGGVPPYAETQDYVKSVAGGDDIAEFLANDAQAAPIVPAKPFTRPAKPGPIRNPQRGPIAPTANPFATNQGATGFQEQAQKAYERTQGLGQGRPQGLAEAANQFKRSALTQLARIPQGISESLQMPVSEPERRLAQTLGPSATEDVRRREGGQLRAISQATEPVVKKIEQAYPVDPNDQSWMTQKIPAAAGSLVPMIASSVLGRGVGASSAATSALSGAAQSAGEVSERLNKAGVQGPQRDRSAALAIATGATEALGLGRALDKIGAKRAILGRLSNVAEDVVQEYGQEYLGDVNAKLVGQYDKNASLSPISRNKLEAAALGGILGGAMQGAGALASKRHGAPLAEPPVQPEPQQPLTRVDPLSVDARGKITGGRAPIQGTPRIVGTPQPSGPAQYSVRPNAQPTQITPIPTGQEYAKLAAKPEAASTTESPAQTIPAGNIAGIRVIAEGERVPASQRRNVRTIVVKQPDGSMQSVRAMLPEGMTPGQARQVLQGAQKAQTKAATPPATAPQPTTEPLTPEAPAQVNPRQAARNENIQKAHEDSIAARTQAEAAKREGRHDEAIRALTVEAEALRALRKQIPDRSRGGRVRRVEAGERLTQIQSEIKAAKIAQRQATKGQPAAPQAARITDENAPTADLTGPLVPDAPQTARMPEAPNRITADLPRPMPRATAEIPRPVDAAMTEPTNRLRNADYPGGEIPRTAGLRPEGQPVEIPAERVQENTNRLPGADYAGGEVRTYQQPQAEGQPVDVSRRPPAPPRPVGPRSVKSGPQGQYGPTTMSAAFPRSRRGLVMEGRRVQGEIEAGRGDKGEYGKLAQSMFKSTRGDVLHGQDSFFHDADVKGALGLTRDAEQGEVRAALKTELARVMGVKSEEVSLTQVPPQAWQNWAGMKQLGEGARAKLQVAIQKYQSPILDELQKTVNPPDSSPPRPIPTDAEGTPKAPSDYQRFRDANAKAIAALNSVSAADAATPGGKRKFDAAADRLRKSAKQMGIDPSHADAIITDAMNTQMEAARRADDAPRPAKATPAPPWPKMTREQSAAWESDIAGGRPSPKSNPVEAPAPKAPDTPSAAETRPRAVSEAEAAPIATGDAEGDPIRVARKIHQIVEDEAIGTKHHGYQAESGFYDKYESLDIPERQAFLKELVRLGSLPKGWDRKKNPSPGDILREMRLVAQGRARKSQYEARTRIPEGAFPVADSPAPKAKRAAKAKPAKAKPAKPAPPAAPEPVAAKPAGRIDGKDVTADEMAVYDALAKVEPRIGEGAAASLTQSRMEAGLSKEAFDRAALSLADKEILALHATDFPQSLSPEGRAALVQGKSEEYIAAALRTPGAKVEKAGAAQTVIKAESIPAADSLDATSRDIETRFRNYLANNFDEAVRRYEEKFGKEVNTDNARELSSDYAASDEARSRYSPAVHEPSSWFAKELYKRKLAESPKKGEKPVVLFTAGGTGAGKTSTLASSAKLNKAVDQSQIIMDGNLNNAKKAIQKIDQALAAGKTVQIAAVYRDPVEAWRNGVLPRAEKRGRAVPIDIHVATHSEMLDSLISLTKHYQNEPRVEINFIDNTRGKDRAADSDIDIFRPIENTTRLRRQLERELKEAYDAGEISKRVYDGTLAGSARDSGPKEESIGRGVGHRRDARRESQLDRKEQRPGGPANPARAAGQTETEAVSADAGGGTGSGRPVSEKTSAGARIRGIESSLKIPRSADSPIRYEVRELGDIQPSHNPFTFEKNPSYRYVNDRDYTSPSNRMDVENATKAGMFDPRLLLSDDPTAANGPPIIHEQGDVLGGNSRTMMLARVYRNHPVDGQKYKDELSRRADMYGLDKAAVARMDQPVLVRVDLSGNQKKSTQKLITDLNIQPGKAMSATEAAIARAKSMPPETMKFISDRLNAEGPDATLAMALEGDKGVAVLNRLIDDDVIPRGDRNRYLTDAGKLSVEAKSEIETMLLSRVFRDADQMKRAAPEIKNKLVRIAPHVAKLAGTDWDIAKYIPNAIQAAAESKAQRIDLEMLNRRGHLFGEGIEYKPEELAIARWIGELGPRQLENRFREYATAYDDFNRGQSLFGAPPNARESFDTIFKPARTGKGDSQGLSFGELDREESGGPVFGSGFGALQGMFKNKPPSGADLDSWMDRMGSAIPETMTDAQLSRFDDLVNRAADAAEAGNAKEWARLSRQAERMVFSRKDRALAEVSGAMNATRSMMASGDLSAPLRQGAILTLPPTQWGRAGRAGKRMLQAISANKYEALKQEIQLHPDFDAAEEAGLYLATNDNARVRGEEDFLRNNSLASRLTERLPFLSHSERAYKMYLDSLRMDTFAKYKQVIEKGGGTAEQKEKAIKAAADWINVATGRGSLGKTFDEAVPLLSRVFFAPRYTASRIQVLNPATYAKNLGNPATRRVFRQQMSEMFQSAAVLTTTAALAKYGLGATVELDDPDSPDWLKIKVGNTRYDVGAGLQQIARLGVRVGRYLDTSARGSANQQGEASDKMVRAVKTFGRSKLAPVPSFFVDWLNNWTNVIGERHTPSEVSMKNPIVSRITPLLWADMVDAYREGGAGKAARFTPGVFGVGVQDYDVNKKRKAGSKVRVRPKAPPMPGPPKGFGEL